MKENSNRIGLCMIVKNESAIIERCLSNLVDIIDEYLIVDTGSTDNTVKIIEDFFAKYPRIKGKVLHHEWKNFGYNRTLSMQEAQKNLNVDWLLTIDADMILINRCFDSSELDKSIGAYQIIQNNGSLRYANIRLLNTKNSWKSVGVTHEFLESENSTRKLLQTLIIDDIGDGGAKQDKFERDIRLLQEGIIEEPNNTRYMFYLANTFKDTQQFDKAVEWYQKRIVAGGWREEVTCSYEYLGICYEQLGKHEQAIQTWLEGFEYNPTRAESIYRAGKNLRERKQYHLAYLYISYASKIKFPENDTLFINQDIYDYLIDYELSILTYYNEPTKDLRDVYLKLFQKNSLKYNNLISNYKFYVKPLSTIEERRIDFDTLSLIPGYRNSSPSIIQNPEGYTVNLRRVSYSIDKKTGYYIDLASGQNCKTVNTINTRIEFDKNFNLKSLHNFDTADHDQKHVNGIEDLKIFAHENKLIFTGNKWIDTTKIRTIVGDYTTENFLAEEIIESPENRVYEKNWVPFLHQDRLMYVYDWSPITIGIIEDAKFKVQKILEKSLPHYRGSSPGFLYNNLIFFLVHNVEYSIPRNYYHSIVILDAETLKFVGASNLFTFDETGIEFGLGLIIENGKVIITHSKWDEKAYIKIYDFDKFMHFIFPV